MSSPLYAKNTPIQVRATKELGFVLDEPLMSGGEFWYRVRFQQRVGKYPEESLEFPPSSEDTIRDLAIGGQWGTLRAFRAAVTLDRLHQTDPGTLHSYRAQRIRFEAHQYKPLLKFLDSPDRRLLIADEVGMGKTIEAGLILAELESRKSPDRVLVVCPSRLMEKWRDELSRKFDMEFSLFRRRDMEEYLAHARRRGTGGRLRAIASIQGLRDPGLRERLRADLDSIDLLVVDEAHHARNPNAQTSQLLTELCELADGVLLLTATPLHLGTRDLFTLLQALRPAEYRSDKAFAAQVHRYRGLYEAAPQIRTGTPENVKQARKIVAELFTDARTQQVANPLAADLLRELNDTRHRDGREWVELERRTQALHPLATVITRSRKRDAYDRIAVRDPKVWPCQWTDEEKEACRRLLDSADGLGWFDREMTLVQIQRARQAASCLPAALRSDWATERSEYDPDDDETNAPARPPQIPLPAVDSKFEKFRELLELIQTEKPGAKILVFTYFVGTSRYLAERLTTLGISNERIAGDVPFDPKQPSRDERGRAMQRFRDDPTIRVLVSTEVGSEGLDFQFCHHLVNYDLPWNPMVVEQRIGRIDRYGQTADKIHIYNLVVEGTVEDRILHRLYQRIGIFRESLGQLEDILGHQIAELRKEYVQGKLSPAEVERRFDEVARAADQRRVNIEELEQKASDLFGHEYFLKEQLRRVGRLGRYFAENPLLALVEEYLHSQHPAVRVWREEGDPFHRVRLTDDLHRSIQRYHSGEGAWMSRSGKGVLVFTCDGEVAYGRDDVELLSTTHPLIKAASEAIRTQFDSPTSRVAKATLTADPSDDTCPKPGEYLLVLYTNTVTGLRNREIIDVVAWPVGAELPLTPDESERLLHLLLNRGLEWQTTHSVPPISPELWELVEQGARIRNRRLNDSEQRENGATFARRTEQLRAEYEYEQESNRARLVKAERDGKTRILPAMRGRVAKAESRHRERMEALQSSVVATCGLSDPIAACVVRVV